MAGQHTHMVSTELTSRHVKKKTTKKGKKEKQQVTPSPTSTQPEDDEQEDRTCATEIVEDVIELTVDRGHGEESEALAVDWPPTPPPPQPIAAPAVNPPPLPRTAFAVSPPPPPPPRTALPAQPPLSAPPTSAEAKGEVPGPSIAPELNILKASSTLPKPKTTPAPAIPPELLEEESDAVQGLKGKVGYIPLKADDPFAYFKPKHQDAKHKMVQCRFPKCGISVKDNGGWSFCKFHRNEMWNDQEVWKKLEEDINGRTIKPDKMTVDMLRRRPTLGIPIVVGRIAWYQSALNAGNGHFAATTDSGCQGLWKTPSTRTETRCDAARRL